MMRGSGRIIAPKAFSRLEHQLAYSTGNKSFPSSENQADESWVGSVSGRKSSVIVPGLNRDGNNPVAAQISRLDKGLSGKRDWVIVPQQFMHDSRPKWGSALHSKRITHWAAIGISNPYGDGVFFVESNGPSISKTAAGAGLGGYSFAEGQRRIAAKALFARFVVAQYVRNDFCRGRRGDAGDREKFGGQQFWFGRQSAAWRDRHTLQRGR